MGQKNRISNDLIEIWKRFIRSYKDEGNDYSYMSQIAAMPARDSFRYLVDYQDFVVVMPKMAEGAEKKDYEILSAAIVQRPQDAAESGRIAAYEILYETNKEYAELVKKKFRLAFKNTSIYKEIGELSDDDYRKIANISGIVTEVQDPLIYDKTKVWRCENNHQNITHADGLHMPRPIKCDEEDCRSGRFIEDGDLTVSDTYQQIKIQRRISGDGSTKIPRELTVIILGKDLVDVANPGDYVICDGIIKKFELTTKAMTALGSFYLDTHFIRVQNEDFIEVDSRLDEKVQQTVRKEHEAADFERLVNSIAPSAQGGYPIKMNLLLMLAGSDPKWLPGKKRHRGELQTLLVGDAGTYKTSYAEFIYPCFNRQIWASGAKGSSTAVGLRASVVYDDVTKASRISAGAYVMASTKYGGIVVIDEVADMSSEDYRSMLEAMDDRGRITIRKHMMSKEIQVNCASLHLCNPKTPGRRWDDEKNIHENTGLDTPMLTRYDTVWVLRDTMDAEEDDSYSDHVLKMIALGKSDTEYQKSRGRYDKSINAYTPQFLQAWSQYVRKTFHPRLAVPSKAATKIQEFYKKMRASVRSHNERQEDAAKTISKITLREVSNLVRLAEASARAHHRDEVLEVDADIAIELIRESVASSGLNPMTGEFIPYRAMKVDKDKVEVDAKDKIWEKNWKNRGPIFYSAIQKISMKQCANCKGKGRTFERGFGEETHPIDCEACSKTGQVQDMFREQDLKDLLYEKMQSNSLAEEMKIDGTISTMKNDGIFMEAGGLLQVTTWKLLEKWASRYT